MKTLRSLFECFDVRTYKWKNIRPKEYSATKKLHANKIINAVLCFVIRCAGSKRSIMMNKWYTTCKKIASHANEVAHGTHCEREHQQPRTGTLLTIKATTTTMASQEAILNIFAARLSAVRCSSHSCVCCRICMHVHRSFMHLVFNQFRRNRFWCI